MNEPLRAVAIDLGIALDRHAPLPLPDQLESAVRDLVASGALSSGARLPSTRALAAQLGVSRGVVVEAFDRLQRQGVLQARPGSGVRVGDALVAAEPVATSAPASRRYAWRFHPALVPPSSFDRRSWRAGLLSALANAPDDALREPATRGAWSVREAVVEQLRRSRGIRATPEHVVMTNGVTHALGMLGPLLRDRGPIGVEEPGFLLHRATLVAAGCDVVAIQTDAEGIVVDALRASGVKTVLLTPAHQMPLGSPLSADRRASILRWAQGDEGLIVEDDYDGELRYDRQSVRALQALDPTRVAYLGTTSKVLSPAVRLGWIVAPPQLVDAVAGLSAVVGGAPSTVEQEALAVVLRSGAFDRSVARMRRRCAAQRTALVDALDAALPDLAIEGVEAGLSIALRVPGLHPSAVFSAADAHDVELYAVADGDDAVVVIGFGDVHEARATEAANTLAAVIRDARNAGV